MIDVMATIDVREGRLDEFLALFKANCPAVLAEDGCIHYYPAVDVDSGHPAQDKRASRVTVVEQWESVAHLQAHSAAPHMKEYGEAAKDMIENVSLRVVEKA